MASLSASTSRILLIEDSRMSGRMLSTAIGKRTFLPIDVAETLADARRLLEQHGNAYRAAVVDLVLPDAPEGEAVDLVCANHIATIVLTGNISEQMRDRIVAKPIVDYVLKQTVSAVEYVANLVRRVIANQSLKVLVVDDSDAFRNYLCRLLQVHRLQVLGAVDGANAQEIMREHPDIRLALVDYEMPGMNGVQLTASLRTRASRAQTCIIGVTGSDNPYIGAQFLKAGADDILRKPFLVEEFYVRIVNHLDTLDHIQLMEQHANRDYLTNLYNRRYLYKQGEALLARARREQRQLAVAVIDIDYFKRINDSHGHEAGDRALTEVARCLEQSLPPSDLVARMGGEEFCIVANCPVDPRALFENIRQRIGGIEIHLASGQSVRLTVSVGVVAGLGESIERMIAAADAALYGAKQAGRDRVMLAAGLAGA